MEQLIIWIAIITFSPVTGFESDCEILYRYCSDSFCAGDPATPRSPTISTSSETFKGWDLNCFDVQIGSSSLNVSWQQ
jgi:hypothetical protein